MNQSTTQREATVPFAQIPAAILTDGRVASCPPLSRLLFHEMYLRAVLGPGRDRIPLQPGLSYATQVRFLVGEDTERLDKLIAAGAVALERDCLRIVLTVAALNAEARQRAQEGASRDGTGEASSDDPEGPDDAPAPRQKPSASKTAMRYRHDAAAFAKRAKGWSRIPRGLSWPEWLQTDEGIGWTATRERTHAGYTLWVTRVTRSGDTPRVTRGDARVTPQGNTPSETSFSSENSEEEKREEREGDAGDTPPVTPQGKASPSKGVTPLDSLRDAAKGNASLVASPTIEEGADATLTRLTLSLDELRAMGAALAKPSDWWPQGKKPAPKHCNLKDLAGFRDESGAYEWGPLLALVSHVRGHAVTKTRAKLPAPIPSRDVDPEFAARFRAEIAAQFPAAPKDAAHG